MAKIGKEIQSAAEPWIWCFVAQKHTTRRQTHSPQRWRDETENWLFWIKFMCVRSCMCVSVCSVLNTFSALCERIRSRWLSLLWHFNRCDDFKRFWCIYSSSFLFFQPFLLSLNYLILTKFFFALLLFFFFRFASKAQIFEMWKKSKKKNQYNGIALRQALFQCMKTVSAHVVRVYVKMFIDSVESSVRLSAPPFSAAAAATAAAFLCLCILCRYRARSTAKHTSVWFDQLVAL